MRHTETQDVVHEHIKEIWGTTPLLNTTDRYAAALAQTLALIADRLADITDELKRGK